MHEFGLEFLLCPSFVSLRRKIQIQYYISLQMRLNENQSESLRRYATLSDLASRLKSDCGVQRLSSSPQSFACVACMSRMHLCVALQAELRRKNTKLSCAPPRGPGAARMFCRSSLLLALVRRVPCDVNEL